MSTSPFVSTDTLADMRAGAHVEWLFRPRGGYCLTQRLPAQVERVTPTRVRVRVQRRDGSFVSRWVLATSLVAPRGRRPEWMQP